MFAPDIKMRINDHCLNPIGLGSDWFFAFADLWKVAHELRERSLPHLHTWFANR